MPTLGTLTFADSAFADAVFLSSGTPNNGDFRGLIGASNQSFADIGTFNNSPEIEVVFTDNVAVNGPGADIFVYVPGEVYGIGVSLAPDDGTGNVLPVNINTPEAQLFLDENPRNPFDFNPNSILLPIDLSSLGLAEGDEVSSIFLRRGDVEGAIYGVGAVHSRAVTPGPGTGGNDRMLGTSVADTLDGLAGNDTIFGYGGNDVLRGKEGADKIYGGDGFDTLMAGAGTDLVYGGAGWDDIAGGRGNDSLYGNAGFDGLYGGDGFDFISGGWGGDEIFGGAQADTIFGDDGNDIVYGGTGADYAVLGKGADLWIDDAQTVFGNDRVFGGGGWDTIQSLGGDDTLTGGAGSDTFYFGRGMGDVLVTDYAVGEDAMTFDGPLWTGPLTQAELDARAALVGGDLVLTLDTGATVTLDGVTSTAGLLDDITVLF